VGYRQRRRGMEGSGGDILFRITRGWSVEYPVRPQSALQWLVGDVDEFLSGSWGKCWKHFPAQIVAPPLNRADIDELFATSLLRIPHFRLVDGGRAIPPSTYMTVSRSKANRETVVETGEILRVFTEGVADVGKVATAMKSGATLVLQGADRFHEPLGDLCGRLTQELGHVCQANAYVTPSGEQGLPAHHDPHDAFVIQSFGTKDWMLTDAMTPVTLQPGDVLYMPSRTVHGARANGIQSSGHVTIGVRATRLRDVLATTFGQVVDDLVPEDQNSGLPPKWTSQSSGAASDLRGLFKQLGEAIIASDPEAVIGRYRSTLQGQFQPAVHLISDVDGLHPDDQP